MATNMKQQVTEANNQNRHEDELPEGFSSARPEVCGAYFRYEEGSVVQGILKGRYPKAGKNAGFTYQIELTKPAVCAVRVGEKQYENKEVPEGTLVSVDEKSALIGLREIVDDPDNNWEVHIRAKEKMSLSGGRTFWNLTVGKRIIQLPF